MKYDKIYQKLKKKFTDEEIVDAAIIPADLSEEEHKKAQEEIGALRMKMLKETSEEERILADVMRLRFLMENYIKEDSFSFEKTFGKYLGEYIRIIKKSRSEIADDLAIHYTKLSRIINDKEEPNIELCYRLEKHSGNLIKTKNWWKLIVKKQEFIIAEDEETKQIEQDKVKNSIRA
jgi:plasmid maintenance system antidote protein VapI